MFRSLKTILLWVTLAAVWICTVGSPTLADGQSAKEMSIARGWMEANLGPKAAALPFSFMYGSESSIGLLKSWKTQNNSKKLDRGRTQQVTTYSDPKTGLEVRCVAVTYDDFPTLEWTVYLKNTGTADTPFIDNLNALDIVQKRAAGEFLLRHSAGSWPGAASYALYETQLGPGRLQCLSAFGGRPSNTDMPYFNLEWDGQGMIVALGWPGQWKAALQRDDRDGLRLTGGQELTHFKLHPGEEVRTPLVAVQFWKGDWVDAQNVWRRWMLAQNLPRPGGKPVAPILSGQSGYANSWMYEATEENQKAFIDRFLELGIKIEYWWMDTGWYYAQGVPENQLTPEMRELNKQGRLWEEFNVWKVNKVRFPHGIKAISDYAHSKGIKTILWFEPERVTPGSWPEGKHPEWCLKASTTPQMLLNLGNEAALKWITDRVHQVLTEEGIDVFRSDFNMDPLDHWRQNDTPDRQGITENHWVTGYLAFWDALLQRNPKLMIDSCASGGRRNDLETMRRGVPLWKCDHAIEPTAMQCQTYGLAFWLPYFGNVGGLMDPYVFRSNMFPAITKGVWEDRTPGHDIRLKNQDYSGLLRLIGQWREIAPNYLGDYYPLTVYNLQTNVWMAWQFHTPKTDSGVVQAFRRPECKDKSLQVKLHGLTSDAVYVLTNLDVAGGTEMTGRELMETGYRIAIETQPGAAVIMYKKKP